MSISRGGKLYQREIPLAVQRHPLQLQPCLTDLLATWDVDFRSSKYLHMYDINPFLSLFPPNFALHHCKVEHEVVNIGTGNMRGRERREEFQKEGREADGGGGGERGGEKQI